MAKLLAGTPTTQPADLKKLIRDEASITPLRKLVALEVLDIELRKRNFAAEKSAPSGQPPRGAATQSTTAPVR